MTTMTSTPRELSSRLTAVAELLDDMTELGEVHNVYCSHDRIAISPQGINPFDKLRVMALWAQRADVPIDLLTMPNHVTIKCAVPYRGLTVTVDEAVYGAELWELSRRLQRTLGNIETTVAPDELLAALDEDEG